MALHDLDLDDGRRAAACLLTLDQLLEVRDLLAVLLLRLLRGTVLRARGKGGLFLLDLPNGLLQTLPVTRLGGLAHRVVPPLDALERRDLDGVAHHTDALHIDERVACAEHQGGLGTRLVHLDPRPRVLGAHGAWHVVDHTARHELVGGEGTGLVEEAVVDLARERDAEGLGAEDAVLHERHQGGVDGHGHLHWQLAGHDRRNDDDALEQELVGGAVALLEAGLQHVAGRDQREAEEDEEREARLRRVGRDLFR
mmetsp:Transcript_25973/g.60817  ORF Transcript_25973/g.60817 Transcript_25973/m.60817 type:complete len:254 (-) Transcript_25973:1882-2643(-)